MKSQYIQSNTIKKVPKVVTGSDFTPPPTETIKTEIVSAAEKETFFQLTFSFTNFTSFQVQFYNDLKGTQCIDDCNIARKKSLFVYA